MADFHEARIEECSPRTGNGSNRVFAVPTPYRTGTIRVFINGVLYPPDDDLYGWVEDSATTVELTTAPRTNDTVSAFYQEDLSIFGGDDVIGTPFAPGQTC